MIPHNLPSFGPDEKKAAAKVLSSSWVAQGPEVEAFEYELCNFFNIPMGHVLAVSSGSAALYLALWAMEGKDKRIGLPVYACNALRNAIGLIGGEPIYLDCKKNSPNIDASAANLSQIDILIAPSIFGIPLKLPINRKFMVIEDIAQSLGAISSGERIGLRGDVGICSFYATKLITSGGQGGAVISRNKAIIDMLRDYREFDCRDDSKLRFNFQMTDLQAAIGRVQLGKLPIFLQKRQKIFKIYRDAGLDLIDGTESGITPVRYRSVISCENPLKVVSSLSSFGIRAILPVEEKELLDDPSLYPLAQKLSRSSVSLPCYPDLHENDANKIAQHILNIHDS